MEASEKLLDKINALLNQANGAGVTDAEREAFLARADQMMMKYKIDEIMLAARASGKAPAAAGMPTHEEIPWVDRFDEFIDIHTAVIAYLGFLTGVSVVRKWDTIHVFGYANDIRYFRQLWTAVYFTFSAKLNPQWSTALTTGENIKMLAESGMKWVPIWAAARRAGYLMDTAKPPADNGKMKRLYAKACKDAGMEKMKLTHATVAYRDSFAVGYRDVIFQRALRLKEQRDDMERAAGDGVSMVLRREATAVEDLLRSMYPDLEASTASLNDRKATNANAQAMGANAGRSVDLAGMGGVGGGTAGPRGALG